jgi:myo-inositol-1(or 4)-monophosphatase
LPASEGITDDDRERLASALRDGGAIALKFFRGALRSWTKGQDSPVSEADIAVNDLLNERLPLDGDGWLSEESEHNTARLTAARVWIVDPIDGTRSYIAGREDWCIAAALVERGRPVLAGVYAPVTDELFIAETGRGATRNGAAISASGGAGLAGARLAGPKRMLERIARTEPGMIVVPRIHSLALRLIRVATGELDGAVAGGAGYDWDLAAADLLVHEAGGSMTALDGRPPTYNRPELTHSVLVVAGRDRHPALVDRVRAQADEPV